MAKEINEIDKQLLRLEVTETINKFVMEWTVKVVKETFASAVIELEGKDEILQKKHEEIKLR